MTDWSAIAAIFGVIAIIVSWAGAYFSWRITRQKATLEFFSGYNQDSKVSAGHKVLDASHGKNFSTGWLKGEDLQNLMYLMNKLEILAAGVNRNLYDKKTIFIVFGRDILDMYAEIQPFIRHIRHESKDGEAFVEFEKLVAKIQKHRDR